MCQAEEFGLLSKDCHSCPGPSGSKKVISSANRAVVGEWKATLVCCGSPVDSQQLEGPGTQLSVSLRELFKLEHNMWSNSGYLLSECK